MGCFRGDFSFDCRCDSYGDIQAVAAVEAAEQAEGCKEAGRSNVYQDHIERFYQQCVRVLTIQDRTLIGRAKDQNELLDEVVDLFVGYYTLYTRFIDLRLAHGVRTAVSQQGGFHLFSHSLDLPQVNW